MLAFSARVVARTALIAGATLPSNAHAQAAAASQPRTRVVEWAPILEAAEIFPSIVLMSAGIESLDAGPRMVSNEERIGDRLGMLGAHIRASAAGRLRLEIEGERRIGRSVIEADVPAGRIVRVFPRVRYRYDELREAVEPADEQITFRLSLNGILAGEETRIVRFRSVDEFPVRQTDAAGEVRDYTWSLAGAVNENDAMVDRVLQESRSRSAVADFAGYAHGVHEVALQVLTVWAALERIGVRVEEASAHHSDVLVVRSDITPWNSTSLRCVEASIVIASVLQRIGLDPVLLLHRDHTLVGFYRDPSHETVVLLDPRELSRLAGPRTAGLTSTTSLLARPDKASLESFQAALKAGERAWDAALTESDERPADHRLIDVALARRAGITPARGRFHDLLR